MWFKNLQTYRLAGEWTLAPGAFEERLARHPLHPCIGLNPQSRGWVGPATTNAQLVYAQGKQMLIALGDQHRSEEHTSELQSLLRISYAGFCLKKKKPID